MKKTFVTLSVLLLGFGCTATVPEKPVFEQPATTTTTETAKPAVTTSTALTIQRSFTLDEIEAQGGLKNWFRDLARANVAGKKILVRVPLNHVFGFGCVAPLKYCVSTETGGCFGPFVDLKGDFTAIKKATAQCEAVCDKTDDVRCTQDFRNKQCSTLWEVEGYVVAANRLPEANNDGTRGGTCADGQLTYDFQVTKVVQKLADGQGDGFRFYEYK